ncbi:MAG TPA: M1 family metallopeptidase [Bryobacteraceae bacterium]
MPRTRSVFLLAAFTSSLLGAAANVPVVDYRIRAQLDIGLKAINGQETLTWVNDSPDVIRELRFHLYLNAFENEKSTFMRESGGQLRGDRIPKEGWGYVEVRKMQVAGGPDLTQAISFVHPDDNNADDRTVIAVALPEPVQPGRSLTLNIEFLSKLPKVFARTGYHNDFFMAGQWYPKIGVYEKAGDRYAKQGGWNCHQFHANSEFFADYGNFDVTFTVPSAFIVGATGVQQSRTDDAQRHESTYRFTQQNVHDFAWTASPKYMREERVFDPDREVSAGEAGSVAGLLGVSASEVKLKPVRMILLIQPEHRGQIDRHFRAVANALKWFGMWYGAYPYQTITVVDPPYGAGGAGGMEYPTLITGGTSLRVAEHEATPEEVVIHEFGHQYWYGMVGSNEFEESWLDEGFNTYSTSKLIDQVYAPLYLPIRWKSFPVGQVLGMPAYNDDALNRAAYLFYRKLDPVVRNAWEYYDSSSYGINSYMRPGVLLRTMENYLGAPVMARIMRTYFARFQFHHPTSRDFEKVVNEVSGQDMSWFFDQFVFGTNLLDYKVESVECNREPVRRGLYVEKGGRVAVTDEDVRRIEKERKKQKEPDQYRIVVKLKREGEAVFPVDMRMTLENGEIVSKQWDGRDRWVKYEFTKASQVKRVEIDPDRKILLDANFTNNSWVGDTAPRPFVKWFSNLTFWSQMVLP